jgi:hypothetical protein
MVNSSVSADAKAVVRRNTEEVRSRGRFEVLEELFANDLSRRNPQESSLMGPVVSFTWSTFESSYSIRAQRLCGPVRAWRP